MSETPAFPEILTLGEVADCLRVSQATVWRWCNNGRLPAFRIGRSWRVRRSDLEDLIEQSLDEGYQQSITNGKPTPDP